MLLTRMGSVKGSIRSLLAMIDCRLEQGKHDCGFTMQ